jgi:uncharacterized Zn-binding protein involved in type VI secretion
MPSIGRVNADRAGGLLLTGNPSVEINGLPAAVLGSLIQDHGRNEHDLAKMNVGFNGVLIGGLPVCRTGDVASCGHPLVSSSNVEAG